MFNNNSQYPYYNNLNSVITGFRITPVGKIEEADSVYPQFGGGPLFFYDNSRNEFFVKQRAVTGEIEVLRYVASKEPIKRVENQNTTTNYDEQLDLLKREITRLNEALAVKVKKEVKNVSEQE